VCNRQQRGLKDLGFSNSDCVGKLFLRARPKATGFLLQCLASKGQNDVSGARILIVHYESDKSIALERAKRVTKPDRSITIASASSVTVGAFSARLTNSVSSAYCVTVTPAGARAES
jgi:hypothetical protein